MFSLVGRIELLSADRIRLWASLTVLVHVALQTSETLDFIDETIIGNNVGTSVQFFCIWRLVNITLYTYITEGGKKQNCFLEFFQSTRFHFLDEQVLFFPKCVMGKRMSESSAAAAVCNSIPGKPACTAALPATKNWQGGREDIPLPWQGHKHCLTVPPSDVCHNSTAEWGAPCAVMGVAGGLSPRDTKHSATCTITSAHAQATFWAVCLEWGTR